MKTFEIYTVDQLMNSNLLYKWIESNFWLLQRKNKLEAHLNTRGVDKLSAPWNEMNHLHSQITRRVK